MAFVVNGANILPTTGSAFSSSIPRKSLWICVTSITQSLFQCQIFLVGSPLTDATPADSDESQHPRTTTPKEACTGSSVSKRITAPGDLFVPLRDIHLAKSGVGWNGQLQLLYSQDTRFYIFTAPKRVPFCFIWRLARRSGLSLRTLHGHGGMDRHRTTI